MTAQRSATRTDAQLLSAAYCANVVAERAAEAQNRAELVSIVIPVLNQVALTRQCIESIARHTRRPYELILVDNGSTEDVAALAANHRPERGRIVVLRNEANEGFAYAVNQGLARATGKTVVVLNNDVLVTPEWLTRQIALLNAHPRIGAVGPMTNRASGPQVLERVDYDVAAPEVGLGAFALARNGAHAGNFVFLARMVGLCMVIKRSLLDTIGGFDTCFGFGNFEDDDFSLRAMRAGFRLAVAQDVFVHHHGSATFKSAKFDAAALMRANWEWFCAKHDYDGTLGVPYPATKLALARPFDAARDFVPLRADDVFHPAAKPLVLEGARERRVLVIADGLDDSWVAPVEEFCATHRASDPVTLVLRIEPTTETVVAHVGARLEEIVANVGEANLPDLLVDTTPFTPAQRGGLYTAVHEWIATASPRAWIHRREAGMCGVGVVAKVRVADDVHV